MQELCRLYEVIPYCTYLMEAKTTKVPGERSQGEVESTSKKESKYFEVEEGIEYVKVGRKESK